MIILVRDLTLLAEAKNYGGDFIREASREAGGFFHILDPAELLRMVQAAEMIAARGTSATPIMAFDSYLMERAEKALSLPTPNFGMLIRFADQ